MKSNLKCLLLASATVALLFGGLAISVQADDIQPPWWRGQWSTTSQYWEFLTPNPGPIQPDGSPPGGQPWLPSTYVYVQPGPGMQWYPTDPSGRTGIWPLSGQIDVMVDNHNPPNDFKWVWVQLTWQPQDPGEFPILFGFEPLPSPNWPPRIVAEVTLPGGWYETTYEWRIYPNPPWERFFIGGTINVDQLVIDTWCIPEPGTLVLAGLGVGMLLITLRRRAQW